MQTKAWKTMVTDMTIAGIIVLLVLGVCGCRDKEGDAQTDSGSIALNIRWGSGSADTAGRYPQNLMHDYCGSADDQIASVSAAVFNSDGALISEGGPWPCENRNGTIEDIKAGEDYLVTVMGRNNFDFTLYTGEGTVDVIAGQSVPVEIEACINASGVWEAAIWVDATACGEGEYDDYTTITISQSGCDVTITSSTGTVDGWFENNMLYWTDAYDEDGGTTTEDASLEIVGNEAFGTVYWTWETFDYYCYGTIDIYAVR